VPTSSPGADSSKASVASVGPIGSRPSQQPASTQAPNPALNKRSTTPLPSPLGYGFVSDEVTGSHSASAGNDASTSKTNDPPGQGNNSNNGNNNQQASGNESTPGVGLGWAGGNTVWRSKNSLGVQASVWG
jgi:hypothetical protein